MLFVKENNFFFFFDHHLGDKHSLSSEMGTDINEET